MPTTRSMSKRASSATALDDSDNRKKAHIDSKTNNDVTFENEKYQYFEKDHRVVIKDGVEKVDFYTVDDPHCDTMMSVVVGKDVHTIKPDAFNLFVQLQEVVLGERVVEIENGVFAESSLKRIGFNTSLKRIWVQAFVSCFDLEEIDFRGTALEEIGFEAFQDCTALQRAEFNESLEFICAYAFKGCKQLQKIVLSENVKEVGSHCFEDCLQLKTVSCNDNLKSFGEKAFCGCGRLEHVALGQGLEFIGKQCFYNCASTLRITLAEVTTLPVALRLSCENPRAVPELKFDRLLVMFFKTPIGTDELLPLEYYAYLGYDFGELEKLEDPDELKKLEDIQKASLCSVRNVLLWKIGQGVYSR